MVGVCTKFIIGYVFFFSSTHLWAQPCHLNCSRVENFKTKAHQCCKDKKDTHQKDQQKINCCSKSLLNICDNQIEMNFESSRMDNLFSLHYIFSTQEYLNDKFNIPPLKN